MKMISVKLKLHFLSTYNLCSLICFKSIYYSAALHKTLCHTHTSDLEISDPHYGTDKQRISERGMDKAAFIPHPIPNDTGAETLCSGYHLHLRTNKQTKTKILKLKKSTALTAGKIGSLGDST